MTKPSGSSEPLLRKRFVLTLSMTASVYGAIWAYRLIGYQTDSVTDILKFCALIFLSCLFFSYIWWRLIRTKLTGLKSGALAGGLTAISIIPLPTFLGAFKSHYTDNHDFLLSIKSAASYSFSTFSLAEFVAIPMSIAVGIWAAKN
ncbi:MAG: hypothetical protein ABJ275_05465 [Maricaulaceae bacterium]